MAGMSVARDALQVFAGNASRDLGERICANLGVDLGAADVRTFSDGEIQVEIKDNVRGSDVFVVQSTSSPGNHNIMELLLLLAALRVWGVCASSSSSVVVCRLSCASLAHASRRRRRPPL